MRGRVGSGALVALLLTTALAQARRTPDLCAAVASGKLGPAQRALRGRGKTAQVRCGGLPVLHHAIVQGAPFEVLLALLHAGSDVNQPDQAGDTPLLLAVRLRDVELVKLLFQYGADPARRNAVGMSAIDEAQQIGRGALLQAMGVPINGVATAEVAELAEVAEMAGASAALDAGQARADVAAPVEDATHERGAVASLDAAAPDHGPDQARPAADVAGPALPAPVVVQEREVAPAPSPATPGLGRKLLLSLLIAAGIALAMRLLLRLAR